MNNKTEVIQNIRDYGISQLSDGTGIGILGCDLHNELYNTNYYVCSRYDAEQELNKYGVFDAIGKIQEYEQDNFGQVITDLTDPEKVLNMLAYIIGEEMLNESAILPALWDDELTTENVQYIITELESETVK